MVYHLIRLFEERVRHRFADDHAGGALDQILQTLQMLDVEGGNDINAGVKDLKDVLIAFVVARAWDIGMGNFIDDSHLRTTGKDRIEVHLLYSHAAVLDTPPRNDLEPFD